MNKDISDVFDLPDNITIYLEEPFVVVSSQRDYQELVEYGVYDPHGFERGLIGILLPKVPKMDFRNSLESDATVHCAFAYGENWKDKKIVVTLMNSPSLKAINRDSILLNDDVKQLDYLKRLQSYEFVMAFSFPSEPEFLNISSEKKFVGYK